MGNNHIIAFKTIGCVVGIFLSGTLTVCASDEPPSTRILVMSYNIENVALKWISTKPSSGGPISYIKRVLTRL